MKLLKKVKNLLSPKETDLPSTTTSKAKKKKGFKPFLGAPAVLENAEEMERVRQQMPPVTMGPMNGPDDKHPDPILAVCKILGHPLPDDAKCGHSPSYYIQPEEFDGKLTTIKRLLGDKMPDYDEEELKSKYKSFRMKYQANENLDRNAVDFTIYFCDWLLYARPRGFNPNDYLSYEFFNKEADVRDTFLSDGFRGRVYRCCNEKEYRNITTDKVKFNEIYKDFIRRDWLDISKTDLEQFKHFLEKHDKFFAKPIDGSLGRGARVIKSNSDTPENLYKICKEERLIVEEIIVQHADIAAINDSSLNTLRINTVLCADGTPKIVSAVARFGRAGSIVDNFHGGGYCAIMDVETGVIISEAINSAHLRTPMHPDSKVVLPGFQFPEWEKVKTTACELAKVVPGLRHIGWDLAVTASGEVDLVEGNMRPDFDLLQAADQVGRKYRYLPYVEELEQVKGIVRKKRKPLKINLDAIEAAKPVE